jgi:cobalt-zinc-cadmium efflux system protein
MGTPTGLRGHGGHGGHEGHGDHLRHARGDRSEVRSRQRTALTWSLGLNLVLLVGEGVAGFLFGSLALLADAAHQLSDVAGLGIALAAHRLMDAPASERHSYGLQRAEVLGAQANGILLLVSAVVIVVEAIRRLGEPGEIAGLGVIAVALISLMVNAGSAWALARVRGSSLNVGGAVTHLLADAAGSVAALVAGVAVVLGGLDVVDPIMAVVITVLVLWSAWNLLRDTTHVLMEGAPPGVDVRAVTETICAHPAVASVHHLHMWLLASDMPALSAHVVLAGPLNLHRAQEHGDELKRLLARDHGIDHATLELECHDCDPEDSAHRS